MYSLAAVYFLYKNVDGFTIIYHCNSRKSYRESKSSVISLSPKGIAKKDIWGENSRILQNWYSTPIQTL
jgi:hypothetical protein